MTTSQVPLPSQKGATQVIMCLRFASSRVSPKRMPTPQLGVLSILGLAQHGLVRPMQTPIDLSYLSDSVLMLRYFEFEGRVRRALSVVKKRSGGHEQTIREFRLSPRGLAIGPPLKDFSGVFTGTPHYTGTSSPLLVDDEPGDH